MESLTKMINILQEEIDALDSLNTDSQVEDQSSPSAEQIEAPFVTDEESVVHEKKSDYPAQRRPPPKPSEPRAFTKGTGSSTETTPSLSRKMVAAIPLLEPSGCGYFS